MHSAKETVKLSFVSKLDGCIDIEKGTRGAREMIGMPKFRSGPHYHLPPSGVASLYKFLYVLGFGITKNLRGTDTTERTRCRGDRDALKSLFGKVEACVLSFFLSFVRPSIRSFVRWYWPCNWAQTLSSARPAKDYTPACPEGPQPNVLV